MKYILIVMTLFIIGCSSGPSGYKSGDMFGRYGSGPSWF